jgi:predicted ATPase
LCIKEKGIDDLENALKQGNNGQTSLQALILLRIEQLSPEQQLVLKYASVIGSEFSESMLSAILPVQLVPNISQSLESLAEYAFIYCIEELSGIAIFGFQNELILSTLYELLPPSDAAPVHLAIAEFIESKYSKNLAPFYAR